MLATRKRTMAELQAQLDGGRREAFRYAIKLIAELPLAQYLKLEQIEDGVGPCDCKVKHWPHQHRERFLSKRLQHEGRWALYCFVVGNGVAPYVFVQWLIVRKMLWYKESVRDMVKIIQEHQAGKYENKTYYDMNSRKCETMWTPNFANDCDPSYAPDSLPTIDASADPVPLPPVLAGCSFWDDAVHALELYSTMVEREP